ncbi:hypothetical protein [Rhizobium rhizogenes]|uniref:hypothetical protein n=1 Tax=Rhizobium rhizogenes TaxID=359 RepID=UPI0022BACE80|nr:hypothetical protein [Rhizobium rhizogenes]MCZ7484505.1 hypothetical protein [Rhizobium rhizogenes]
MISEDDRFWVRWSLCAQLMRTRIPGTIGFLTALAFVIGLGRSHGYLLETLNNASGVNILGGAKIMFMGSVFILIAIAIYWIFCPSPIKAFKDRRDYVEYVTVGIDPVEIAKIKEVLSSVLSDEAYARLKLRSSIKDLNFDESSAPTALIVSDYYSYLDRTGLRLPLICLSMASLGILLFLMPATINVITALPDAMTIFDDRGMPM